jgi:2,4-dienoyl-CoA reductase-like NADH-dependent reductase (Old Yellow Enzyme family)
MTAVPVRMQAVHDKGCNFVCQLWHVGRVSHPDFQPNGGPTVAPSAIGAHPDLPVQVQIGCTAQ